MIRRDVGGQIRGDENVKNKEKIVGEDKIKGVTFNVGRTVNYLSEIIVVD